MTLDRQFGKAGWSKLGHPSLVHSDDAAARIGGELLYADGVWTLTNRSGRYGMFCGRKPVHLNNVAACLGLYGLNVEPDFIGES